MFRSGEARNVAENRYHEGCIKSVASSAQTTPRLDEMPLMMVVLHDIKTITEITDIAARALGGLRCRLLEEPNQQDEEVAGLSPTQSVVSFGDLGAAIAHLRHRVEIVNSHALALGRIG